MLCISNSFWVLRASKSWWNHFFQPFFNLFWSKINQKRQFRVTPSGSWPAFACRPALRSQQNHVFSFIFISFLLISAVKSLKKVWNDQKRLKNGWKKMFRPAFGCAQYPKSCQNTQQTKTKEAHLLLIFRRTYLNCYFGETVSVWNSENCQNMFLPNLAKLHYRVANKYIIVKSGVNFIKALTPAFFYGQENTNKIVFFNKY